MEGANDYKKNGPSEASLGPVLSSEDEDQLSKGSSTTQQTNGEMESHTQGPVADVSELVPDDFDFSTANPFATSHITADGIGSEHHFGMPVVSQEVTLKESENEVPQEALLKKSDNEVTREHEFHEVGNQIILTDSISNTLEAEPHDAAQKHVDSVLDRPNVQENDAADGPLVEHEASTASAEERDMNKLQKEENIEAKAGVQPSSVVENITYSQPRNGTVAILTTVASFNSNTMPKSKESYKQVGSVGLTRGQIDTAAPFESVKAAVSKFGGILDWKAHRVHTVERRKFIELDLERAKEEIPLYKKQAEAAEEAKVQVVKEFNITKRLVEELKLNLERAQTEEQQTKQDSELAKLRVEEMEQGIADDASIAARAQLEVARARNAAVVSELITIKDELEQLRRDYALLMTEKDVAINKAGKTISMAKEVEKSVENLTVELISTKESMESAQAEHLEADDNRVGAVMAKEQDILTWEKELKDAGGELEKLNQRISLAKYMKSKLDTSSSSLQYLKTELASYMESNSKQETIEEVNLRDALEESEKKTHVYMKAAIASAGKELETTKLNIEKAKTQVNCLEVESVSLKSEVEKEKSDLASFQQREGMASITIAALQDKLNSIKSEIVNVQNKEKEAREKKIELLKKVEDAAQDAEGAKTLARMAQERLHEATAEAEEEKQVAATMESRLRMTQKEIESAKASEKVALAAINALQASESATDDENTPAGLMISLEEYYDLNKRVHEAEEQANMKLSTASSQIEVARESELRNLSKLQEVNRVMADRKDALEVAIHKADNYQEEKLEAEQELRKWRAEHEERRKADEPSPEDVDPNETPGTSFDGKNESANSITPTDGAGPNPHTSNTEADSSREVKSTHKKKKFFPRIFMFFARKKVSKSK